MKGAEKSFLQPYWARQGWISFSILCGGKHGHGKTTATTTNQFMSKLNSLDGQRGTKR